MSQAPAPPTRRPGASRRRCKLAPSTSRPDGSTRPTPARPASSPARPSTPRRCISRAWWPFRAADRRGRAADGAVARHRPGAALLSAQPLRGLPHPRPLRRGAGLRPARRGRAIRPIRSATPTSRCCTTSAASRDEAIACAERALAINDNLPGAHFGLAEALLLRGDSRAAGRNTSGASACRASPALMPPTTCPQWDGEPLKEGRLMLIADQGFGDGIQFARYIPWAAERCAGRGAGLQPRAAAAARPAARRRHAVRPLGEPRRRAPPSCR